MNRMAQMVAERTGAQSLITGESIGQVASQTMEGLAATDDAVTLPVFRPLIGMDKNQVVDMAREIGTYDISIQPYEDCCTVFVAKHPQTKPRLANARSIEKAIELTELIEKSLTDMEKIGLVFDGGQIIENRQDSK
jgi:thiamine biosynthesis protein ThiI